MRIGRLGHAGVVVWQGDFCCLMDPVFVDPFEGGANTMDPPVSIDAGAAAKAAQCVVLSHAHMDHFCVRSLAELDRDTPVLYPAGDALIEGALARLGFTAGRSVGPGDKISVGPLSLYPTTSRAPFPEMGMLFQGGGQTFWNMVDSVVDDAVVEHVRALAGRPDLVFAKYQPLVESELFVNALGSDFPAAKYAVLLKNVWALRPRAVAASSCGYRYVEAWLNDRGFPVTEAQFEADLQKGDPSLRVLHVPHGATVELGDATHEPGIDPNGVPFVRRRGERVRSSFDWRPEKGVPPLADRNPRGFTPARLREIVDGYLDDDFLHAVKAGPVTWLERLARHEVKWRLEIVFPGDERATRWLDFADLAAGWLPDAPDAFCKLHTSVTASAIVGLIDGGMSAYALSFNHVRIAERLYAVSREGVSRFGTVDDEPILKILGEGADQRFVDREVDRILGNRASRPQESPP